MGIFQFPIYQGSLYTIKFVLMISHFFNVYVVNRRVTVGLTDLMSESINQFKAVAIVSF